MGFTKPQVMAHSSARQPIQGYGFVDGNGADDPETFGGFVAAAVRLETAGAVPFLRITMERAVNLDRVSIVPSVRGDTFAHPQIASLTADPEGAPVTGQFDVVYFDAAGAEIEPLDGARLDLTLVGDLSAK
jgi:hypothetical protein